MDDPFARWLLLREPADRVARSQSLTDAVAGIVTTTQSDTVHVLDLATGTGSNLRFLVNHLSDHQSWLAVDRDPTLLAQVHARTSAWGASQAYQVSTEGDRCIVKGDQLNCEVMTRVLDLGRLDSADIFVGRHLVTASALLDLVSTQWLTQLAAHCRAVGAAALFTINYNGRSTCEPAEPEDETIRNLFNQHQRRDTGLGGLAAGPEAAERAAQCFADVGYLVRTASSNWVLGSAEGELQRRLIDGWAKASTEMAPDDFADIEDWRARRVRHVEADRSRVLVGHVDLAAWPSDAAGNGPSAPRAAP